MGGVLFQYGTAVHLAILTVAPLFLLVFCGPPAHAAVLFWLALIAATWVVMHPSPREGEWPRDARHRIGWELGRDPFLSFCIVALILSIVRAANGGIGLAYNQSAGRWYMKEAFVSLLPGSVSGTGLLPLAGVLGTAVTTLGVRHALGSSARQAYLTVSGVLAAAAVVLWWTLAARGVSVPRLVPELSDPFFLGSLLGTYFLFALAAWVASWYSGSAVPELVSALSCGIILCGLLLYATTAALWLFAAFGVLLVALGAALAAFRRPPAAWWRTVVALTLVLAPVAFLFVCGMRRPSFWPLFPDGFVAIRDAATAVAFNAWRGATQLGRGLGSYPLAQGFFATAEDWQVLAVTQTAVPNGWVQILFERGMLGLAVMLIGLAILLRDGIVRYVRAGSAWTLTALHLLGPFVLAAAASLLFVECTYAQLEALMPVGAALALSAAALPESSEAHHG